MCGYVFGAEKPLIFVPESALKRNEKKVIKESEIERAIMPYEDALPNVGTNLKKGRIANIASNGKTQCPPLRLTWVRPEDWTFTEKFESKFSRGEDRKEIQKKCFELLMQNVDAIRSNPNYSELQKTEILERILPAGGKYAHIRNLHGDSQVAYFKQIYEAHQAGTAPAEHVAECDPLNFIITYRDYNAPHANNRYIYVIFYTDATQGVMPGIKAVDVKSRIPKTNGKSVFSIHAHQVDHPVVAGGIMGVDESRLETPELFEFSLRNYVKRAKDAINDGLIVSRCFQRDNQDRFVLDKKKYHWTSKKENDVEKMCIAIGRDFDIKIKISYVRGGAKTFNVKTIEW
jgi:hypothetical protein